jgi:hypothetical protein
MPADWAATALLADTHGNDLSTTGARLASFDRSIASGAIATSIDLVQTIEHCPNGLHLICSSQTAVMVSQCLSRMGRA